MRDNFYGNLFLFIRGIIRIVYPKYTVQIPTNVNRPVVYISHHQNFFGPFITMLWFPKHLHAWILHVLLDQQICFKHYVNYTFTKRFGLNKYLANLLAFPYSFLVSTFLNSGKGIPVYRGSRKILQTFHISVAALSKRESIIIFPDIDYSDHSSTTKEMYDGFLHLEKFYYKATGKHVCFIPLYASKNRRMLIANQEIYFRDGEDFNEEKQFVYKKIHDNLNHLAEICGDL
jgi:1-acyl-sn-glycerol-3-phosphate acyltransferase